MKSLRELLAYYEGCVMGAYATSERQFGAEYGPIAISDKTRIIDSALLYDADRLAKASLASFLACSHLRSGGHGTWGEISLYYARFHIILALVRLVGIALEGKWALIRTDEHYREYKRIRKDTQEAREIGCGGAPTKKFGAPSPVILRIGRKRKLQGRQHLSWKKRMMGQLGTKCRRRSGMKPITSSPTLDFSFLKPISQDCNGIL